MTQEILFEISSSLALIGWLLFIFLPNWKWTGKISITIIVSLLAIIYAYLLTGSLSLSDLENFTSLDGIVRLFENEEAILAGWVHYLAFDLLAGWFITRDSQKHGIRHLYIVPCLLFAFMLGPIGFLLYIIIRWLLMGRLLMNP